MESQTEPCTETTRTSVWLLAAAAESQIVATEEVARNGSPTCAMNAEMAKSSLDWDTAWTAASRGATGFIRRINERQMAAYADATAMSRIRIASG
jgi:hypothetical protein